MPSLTGRRTTAGAPFSNQPQPTRRPLVGEENDIVAALVEAVQKPEQDTEGLTGLGRIPLLRLFDAPTEEAPELGDPGCRPPRLLHEVLGVDLERLVKVASQAGVLEGFCVRKQIGGCLLAVRTESRQVEVLPGNGVQPGRRQESDRVGQHVAHRPHFVAVEGDLLPSCHGYLRRAHRR